MDKLREALIAAGDAWRMTSWLIWPDNEIGPANPDKLEALARALDDRGVEGGASTWPDALRVTLAWPPFLSVPIALQHRPPMAGVAVCSPATKLEAFP